MKKTTIAAITAALLLAAVLCTAGCVEAPSDPIVGTYVAETDSAVSYAVFENDGTGYFAEAAAEETETGEDAWVLTGTCSWTATEPKNTYTLLFADGETETATLDAERGLLTIKEVVYQKYPSPLSGVHRAFAFPEGLSELLEATEIPGIKNEQFGPDILFDT